MRDADGIKDADDMKLDLAPPFETISVPIDSLDLDLANPRFFRDADSQDDALQLMMLTSGDKCVELLSDILAIGQLNSSDLPIVVRAGQRYRVLEGNRRLTCLRLWGSPSLLSRGDTTARRYQNRVERLVARSQYRVPLQISVTIAPSEEAAGPWIDRKHSKGMTGAGTVQWGAAMKDRRLARQDPAKRSRALAFIELVSSTYKDDQEVIDALEVVRDSRYSFIQRFIDRPISREKLGLDYRDGDMSMMFSAADTLPIIRQVLTDFAKPAAPSGKSWARELNTTKEFETYLESHEKLLPATIGEPLPAPPTTPDSPETDAPDTLFSEQQSKRAGAPLNPGPVNDVSLKSPDIPAPAGHEAPSPGDNQAPYPGDNQSPISCDDQGPGPGGDTTPVPDDTRTEQDPKSSPDEQQYLRPPRPAPRHEYIFRGLDLHNFSTRIQRMIRQTSLINVFERTEIPAVMLRVILDLTCYQFLTHSGARDIPNHLDKRIRMAIKAIEPNASDDLKAAEITSPLRRAFHETTPNTIQLVQYAVHNGDSGPVPSEVLILAERYAPLLVAMNNAMGKNPAV